MFQISPLRRDQFEDMLRLDDGSLRERGARRYVADRKPGFPCRVSLQDAEIGERVVLLPYQHQHEATPYSAFGPIFVRETAETASLPPDTIPSLLRTRVLSVRAYDAQHLMGNADLTDGQQLEGTIAGMFADPRIVYLHIHYAKPGCYACRVDRSTRVAP
jgi:hypothetical protein